MYKSYPVTLTVIFGNNCTSRTFYYEHEEVATLAYTNLQREVAVPGRRIEITDSKGVKATFNSLALMSVILTKISDDLSSRQGFAPTAQDAA